MSEKLVLVHSIQVNESVVFSFSAAAFFLAFLNRLAGQTIIKRAPPKFGLLIDFNFATKPISNAAYNRQT